MKFNKEERKIQNQIIKKKFEIAEKYRLIPSLIIDEMLDDLWDDNKEFQEDKLPEVIDKIKTRRRKNKLENKRLFKEASKDIESFGLIHDEDYSIGHASKGKEHYISLTFRLKGNKKIIDHFTSKGWLIDRRYKNEDGDPSIFASDWHGKNMYFNVVMIVMKYIIEEW